MNGQEQATRTQEPKKAIYRRWWFISIVVVAAIIVAASVSQGGKSNTGKIVGRPSVVPSSAVPPAPIEESRGASPETSTPESTTPAPTPASRPVVYSGRGAKVLRIAKGSNPMLATFTHHGAANFVVTSLDASGDEIDLLVNTIGQYGGTHVIDALEGEETAAFKIEADGAWTVTLKPLASARVWDGARTIKGHGDDVIALAPDAFAGLDSVKLTHDGEANFVVSSLGDSQELLVNEIGKYSGEQLVPAGAVLLVIEADGNWTATKV